MPILDISKFSGNWTNKHAAHLLRRIVIGPSLEQITWASNAGLEETVNSLLMDQLPLLTEPINYRYEEDPNVPLGASWINADYTPGKDGQRRRSYDAWEVGNLIQHSNSIHAKMTLFWYNHFVTESVVVGDARAFYKFMNIFREFGLGNFRDLVNKVTVSMAMLIYLNGDENIASAPNENYARELFELFTIGKGEQIETGNYTNYTETDIAEAAKVLTGYKTVKNPKDKVEYKSLRHDNSSKHFTAAFDNEIINNLEDEEYKALVHMILKQKETARFITRKIYRWFLYYEITPDIEANVIEPLADIFYESDYNINTLLKTFFCAEHFHDEFFWGTQIKHPVEFDIGLIKQLKVSFPEKENYHELYSLWYKIYQDLVKQQQDISNPPDVSGWKAYYQEPLYYRTWINSVTLPLRQNFTLQLLNDQIKYNGIPIEFDPFVIVDDLTEPEDPNKLILQLGELFFQIPLSEWQNSEFKEVLIPGLPDFEWTVEYGDYKAHPGNQEIRIAVKQKLIGLFSAMLNKAEYQLC